MDAVALGLLMVVMSSYVMWYRLKAQRRGGIMVLLLAASAADSSSWDCSGSSDIDERGNHGTSSRLGPFDQRRLVEH